MNFQKYENKLPYPKTPQKPYFSGVNSEGAKKFAEDLKKYEDALAPYRQARDAYREESNRLYEQFKQDALAEVGLAGHPKADKVFAKAWGDGHSNGYSEVFSYLVDLAELVL